MYNLILYLYSKSKVPLAMKSPLKNGKDIQLPHVMHYVEQHLEEDDS